MAFNDADIIQNTPILLPINPGVSLQSITVLPNFTSQKSLKIFLKFGLLSFEDTISSNLRYLGGLKK